MLTSKQRAFLRAKANGLDAIFQIGKGGITDNLLTQIGETLEARELIKLSVLESSMMTAKEASAAVCEALEADPVQCVGYKFVIYRRSSEKPTIVLPKA